MEIVQLLLQILIVILGFYLVFSKSYFSELGKQLALKEHIEDLTRKVEGVKSDIDLFAKTKFDLATNKRTAILDYHSTYFDWRNSVLALYPSVIDEKNFESVDQFFNEVRTKELLASNSEDRLVLFDNSEESIGLRYNTKMACIELQNHTENYFRKVAYEYMMFHYSKKTAPEDQHINLQKEHQDKVMTVNDEFRKKKLELFQVVVSHDRKLSDYLRQQLFSELEE